MHTIKVMDVPFGKFRDKGVPIDNISNFNTEQEYVVGVFSQSALNLYQLIFVSKMAMLKVTSGGEFDVTRRTIQASKLMDDDELVAVAVLNDQKQIVLKSNDGYFLRFGVEEIPEKKKAAVGVRGMKLSDRDFLDEVYFTTASGDNTIEYHDVKLDLHRIKLGKRDGKGTKLRI